MQENACWPGGLYEGVGVQRGWCRMLKGDGGEHHVEDDTRAGSLRMRKRRGEVKSKVWCWEEIKLHLSSMFPKHGDWIRKAPAFSCLLQCLRIQKMALTISETKQRT